MKKNLPRIKVNGARPINWTAFANLAQNAPSKTQISREKSVGERMPAVERIIT